MENILVEKSKELPRVESDAAKYRELAWEMYEKYKSEIDDNVVDVLSEVNLPDDVLRRYWGHGIVRGATADNLANLLSVLETGVVVGDVGSLVDGQPNAYTDAEFFLISRKGGRSIVKGLEGGAPERVFVDIRNGVQHQVKKGFRADIGAIVCGRTVGVLVEPLRKLFPHANIIAASELQRYIEAQEAAH